MSFWSTVGGLVGGFFGGPVGATIGSSLGGSIDDRDDRRRASGQQAQNVALQREFAQRGVQWRVEDAQRSGVHPLFALGAPGAAFSPNPIAVGSPRDYSQNISRAFETQLPRAQLALIQAQTEAARAAAAENLAQAQYWGSEVARRSQQAGPGMPSDVVVGAYRDPAAGLGVHPLDVDAIRLTPDDRMSRSALNPAVTAARDHPSMREFIMANGDRVLLPATQPGQFPEDMSLIGYLEAIGANVQRYGYRSIPDALARWMGISPEARRGRTVESLVRELWRKLPKVPYVSPWERR